MDFTKLSALWRTQSRWCREGISAKTGKGGQRAQYSLGCRSVHVDCFRFLTSDWQENPILYSVGICWRPGKSCFFPVLLFLATILFVPFEIFLLIELYPRLEEPAAFERKKMAFLVIIRRFNRCGKAKKPRSLAKNFLAVILLMGTVSVSFVSVYFSDDIFAPSRTFKFSLIQGEEIWHRKTLWKGYWLRLITGQSGARSMCNALRMG